MPLYKQVLCVSLLCIASTANANIYKCKDADGRIVFSDKACGENARIVELKPSTTLAVKAKTGYSDNPDLLICSGGHGSTLPIKLCDPSKTTYCLFRSVYLKNIITDTSALRNDISDTQIDLIKMNIKRGDVLWEFSGPSNGWDSGTGIRGYVILRKLKAIFYMVDLYQGLPNKPPKGSVRYLSLKGPSPRCKHRNIMDRE